MTTAITPRRATARRPSSAPRPATRQRLGRGLRDRGRHDAAPCWCPTARSRMGKLSQAIAHGATPAPGRRQLRRLPDRWPASWPRPTRSSWSTRSTRRASRVRRRRRSRSSTPSATPRTSTASRSATPATSRRTGWATRSTARRPTSPARRPQTRGCGASRRPARRRSCSGHPVDQPDTIATAIRIGNPASWQQAVAARDESRRADRGGHRRRRSWPRTGCCRPSEGVFVEPASAASAAGLLALHEAGRLDAGPARRLHRDRPRAEGPGVGDQGLDGGAVTPVRVPVDAMTRGRGARPRGLSGADASPWVVGKRCTRQGSRDQRQPRARLRLARPGPRSVRRRRGRGAGRRPRGRGRRRGRRARAARRAAPGRTGAVLAAARPSACRPARAAAARPTTRSRTAGGSARPRQPWSRA